jgi:hypothetical protein
MRRRTIVSVVILSIVICFLVGLSMLISDLWVKYLSHWVFLSIIALITTLLLGLVLMDEIFELGGNFSIILERLKLKIEIGKHLVGAFFIVCGVAVVLELVQFFLSSRHASWSDPLIVISGAFTGIIIHIIGSKSLMKRVEFELERWEDNVL